MTTAERKLLIYVAKSMHHIYVATILNMTATEAEKETAYKTMLSPNAAELSDLLAEIEQEQQQITLQARASEP